MGRLRTIIFLAFSLAVSAAIRGNHLLGHATGEFPVRRETLACNCNCNPNPNPNFYPNANANANVNAIKQQSVMLRLPLEPVLINEPHCVRVGMIGFAMLGPIDERGKTGRNEYLDDCHGRVGAVLNAGVVQRKDYCHFTREYAYTIGCFRVSKVIQKIERWHL